MKWIRAASISVLLLPLSFTTYARADANIITVAAYGADFTNPLDAVDAITDADRSNPYIIQIAPGRYNLGASPLYLKEYVSLVGSGQKATYIVGAVDSISGPAPGDGPGVINGADNSEIRDLTVINRYPGTAHAINNYGVANSISDVTAIARGGGGSGAFKAGIWNAGGSNTTLTHVTSRAVGTGGKPLLRPVQPGIDRPGPRQPAHCQELRHESRCCRHQGKPGSY